MYCTVRAMLIVQIHISAIKPLQFQKIQILKRIYTRPFVSIRFKAKVSIMLYAHLNTRIAVYNIGLSSLIHKHHLVFQKLACACGDHVKNVFGI